MCHINELSIHGFRLKDHKACDTQLNYRDLKKGTFKSNYTMNFIQEKKTVLCDQFCTFKKLMNS